MGSESVQGSADMSFTCVTGTEIETSQDICQDMQVITSTMLAGKDGGQEEIIKEDISCIQTRESMDPRKSKECKKVLQACKQTEESTVDHPSPLCTSEPDKTPSPPLIQPLETSNILHPSSPEQLREEVQMPDFLKLTTPPLSKQQIRSPAVDILEDLVQGEEQGDDIPSGEVSKGSRRMWNQSGVEGAGGSKGVPRVEMFSAVVHGKLVRIPVRKGTMGIQKKRFVLASRPQIPPPQLSLFSPEEYYRGDRACERLFDQMLEEEFRTGDSYHNDGGLFE